MIEFGRMTLGDLLGYGRSMPSNESVYKYGIRDSLSSPTFSPYAVRDRDSLSSPTFSPYAVRDRLWWR